MNILFFIVCYLITGLGIERILVGKDEKDGYDFVYQGAGIDLADRGVIIVLLPILVALAIIAIPCIFLLNKFEVE